jgi:uncharacterized protein YecE (DUF72 family)
MRTLRSSFVALPQPRKVTGKHMPGPEVCIGTAGWNVPKQHAALCSEAGSHLERYSAALRCAEVNSSFYRPHAAKQWAKWAAAVPADFRFAVKAPKTCTHDAKLVGCGSLLAAFFEQVAGLGEKLGPVLVQLPPKLEFEEGRVHEFFTTLRELHPATGIADRNAVVCEPRHASWFTPAAARLLAEFEVARVAADPAKGSPLAAKPGGWRGLRYFRWHGSPRTYWSEYSAEQLKLLAEEIKSQPKVPAWVIFDNTAMGHAFSNAVELRGLAK